MTPPSRSIRIGLVKPNVRILSAIWRICLAEWVRGLRAYGFSAERGTSWTFASSRKCSTIYYCFCRDDLSHLDYSLELRSWDTSWFLGLSFVEDGSMPSISTAAGRRKANS